MGMTEDQGLRLGDLRGMVRRRWPVAVTLAGAMALLAILVAAVLPNVYEASATLLVEPQSISKKLIESGVAESDLNNRLHLMTMQILSRPRLSKIIDDLKLYPEESEKMTREEVIELMRKHISVEPVLPELETAARRNSNREIEINTFRLNFSSESAETAAAVANRLANDFIDEHIKERVQISGDTSEFIEAELQRLAGRIREVEAQTAQIKNDNPGRLPEDVVANQRLIEHAVESLRQAQRDYSAAQSDEAFYRQASLQAGVSLPRIDDADPSRRVEMLELKLGEYRSRGFTDKHPDILSTQLEIDQLRQRLETEEEDQTPRSVPQQQAEAEMRRAQARAAAATEDIRRLAAQIDEYNARLVATPRVEEQLAGLSREYEGLLKNMENYGAKRLEASTAANMERRQKGEQFRVLDSAIPPPQPTSPKRLVIILVGFILGIAFGGGVAVLLESADTSFHGARDLQSKLRIPVLAEIPEILLDSDRAANRRRHFRTAFAASLVVFLVLVGSGGGYFFVNVLPGWRAEEAKPPETTTRPGATPGATPTPTPAPAPAPPAAAQPVIPQAPSAPSAGAAAPAAGA
jgi:polysaccharide chain length determinant protein (PEP-CTERM system associated)